MILYIVIAVLIVWLIRKKLKANHECYNDDIDDHENVNFEYEVAIIGSGILGSALAAVLGRDGRKVAVIERNLEMPERFIGELLQPGGCKALKTLGLQDCLLDIDAQNVFGYTIYGRQSKEIVELPYPLDSDGSGGQAFNNGRFVMKLREKAMSEKNVTYVEGNVTNLVEINNIVTGVIYKPKDQDEEKIIKAKLTIVAEGCFSKLRKHLSEEKPQHLSSFIAGIVKNCPAVKSDFLRVLITDPNPVIIYPIASDSTRFLIDVREKVPMKDMQNYLKDKVSPQLPEPFRDAFLEAITSVPLRSMPANMMAAAPKYKRGALLLGDALDLRHPITGNGMTVALCDIVMLRSLFLSVDNLADYKAVAKISRKFYSQRRINHTFVINILANAMFEIFAANDEWSELLQDATLRFYKLGGKYLKNSVELLASLNTTILQLITTLLYLSLYSVYLPFKDNRHSSYLKALYESIRICAKTCSLSAPFIWSETKYFFK